MTFERLSPLPADYCAALRSWCDSMRPRMQETNSRFAQGRKTLWLINHVHLGTGEVTPAPAPEWLYRLVGYLLPGCDAVQLSCGAPIAPHRDHKAFDSVAVGINLGEANFLYEKWPGDSNLMPFPLEDGDVYRFYSTRLHGSRELSENRYSLNLWTLRPNYRPAMMMPDVEDEDSWELHNTTALPGSVERLQAAMASIPRGSNDRLVFPEEDEEE